MQKHWVLGVCVSALALVGACSEAPSRQSNATAEVEISQSASMTDASAQKVAGEAAAAPASEPGDPPSPPQTPGAPSTTTALLLAYSYSATLSLPTDNVAKTMKDHEQRCITAGPALCQVVTAASQKEGDFVRANLTLRATPAWLGTFRGGLEQDAKGADGKVVAQGVTSEDLTRNITDSEARLRALKSLRTRIEALIASRPGKLADLLEAERELARVQGEIDSFESNLSVMRARVNMSTMEMTYQSRALAVSDGTFSPLADAFTNFFGVIARSLAALITLFAAILPFALVIVPVVYYGLKWRTKRRATKVAASPVT
jgi:Domain of unknown function (DUF4349)